MLWAGLRAKASGEVEGCAGGKRMWELFGWFVVGGRKERKRWLGMGLWSRKIDGESEGMRTASRGWPEWWSCGESETDGGCQSEYAGEKMTASSERRPGPLLLEQLVRFCSSAPCPPADRLPRLLSRRFDVR